MLIPTTFVAALALLATPTAAMPSAAPTTVEADALEAVRNASLPKLVYAEAINGGLWTVYDDESKPLLNATGNESSSPQRRCGSNNIHCDFVAFRAFSSLCGQLMDIMGSPENIDRSMSPYTQQCFTATDIANNNVCCITWAERIIGVKVRHLFGAAAPMLSQCSRDGLVSARATDVDLAGHCTVQCMSNRPDGCY